MSGKFASGKLALTSAALESVSQRTVGVYFLFANQAFVGPAYCIQSTAATLDTLAHENDTKRHSKDHQSQKGESKKESCHDYDLTFSVG
jgi:hypothetical protein